MSETVSIGSGWRSDSGSEDGIKMFVIYIGVKGVKGLKMKSDCNCNDIGCYQRHWQELSKML